MDFRSTGSGGHFSGEHGKIVVDNGGAQERHSISVPIVLLPVDKLIQRILVGGVSRHLVAKSLAVVYKANGVWEIIVSCMAICLIIEVNNAEIFVSGSDLISRLIGNRSPHKAQIAHRDRHRLLIGSGIIPVCDFKALNIIGDGPAVVIV